MSAPIALPTSQKAIVQGKEGQPELVHDAPIPGLRPGTILVKTLAVALNPFDYKMGAAFLSPGATMGLDFAGEIVQIGSEIGRTDLKVGEWICGIVHGSNPADHDSGSFAEYIRVPADMVLKIPPGLALEEAASLGTALTTSCMALHWLQIDLATPASGSTVSKSGVPALVYGGSTASGTMAIQLLKLLGFDPIATCSPRHFNLVKSYGASATFDYSAKDVGQTIKIHTAGKLRHILDCIVDQASIACCCTAMARPGGRLALLEACPDAWKTRNAVKTELIMSLEAFGDAVQAGGDYGRPANAQKHEWAVRAFQWYQELLTEGKLMAHPTRVVGAKLDEILEGLRELKSGSVSGQKLVVYTNRA